MDNKFNFSIDDGERAQGRMITIGLVLGTAISFMICWIYQSFQPNVIVNLEQNQIALYDTHGSFVYTLDDDQFFKDGTDSKNIIQHFDIFNKYTNAKVGTLIIVDSASVEDYIAQFTSNYYIEVQNKKASRLWTGVQLLLWDLRINNIDVPMCIVGTNFNSKSLIVIGKPGTTAEQLRIKLNHMIIGEGAI